MFYILLLKENNINSIVLKNMLRMNRPGIDFCIKKMLNMNAELQKM